MDKLQTTTKTKMKIRSYSELIKIDSFEARFEYLKLGGGVGVATFGYDRYLNQNFYGSAEWRYVRRQVIVRDQGCDLGVPGYDITSELLVHHMNPITDEDIIHGNMEILDPEFLIVTTHQTHNAIHYGDRSLLPKKYTPRSPNDTKLW